MVSFSCEACGDVLTKKKLDGHRNQCWGASFTCLDCMVHFQGTGYRAHTSCISEAQKYQGHLYKEKEKEDQGDKRKSVNGGHHSQAMVPHGAYVEDVPEGDEMNAVAVLDVPPRAPTPPSAPEALPASVNVFDYLVTEETANGSRRNVQPPAPQRQIEHPTYYGNGDSQVSHNSNGDRSYLQHGYSYGSAPIEPALGRYDSWQNLAGAQASHTLMPPPPYVTPDPKDYKTDREDKARSSEKRDKKRKRQNVEELDLSTAKRPTSRDAIMTDAPAIGSTGRVLHSGLTGGLHKLVTNADFFENDRIEAGPTPISPIKRSRHEKELKDQRRRSSYTSYGTTSKSGASKYLDAKHHHRSYGPDRDNSQSQHKHNHRKGRDSSLSDDRHRTTRKEYKAIEYPDRPGSVQPTATNQVVSYMSRAELFLSFIDKGPDSERGCSMNKALKRYHRECDVRGEEKEEDDKELWKALRMRRNERGEIVLFI